MKRTVHVAFLLSFAAVTLAVLSSSAQAQKVDLAFGISTIDAPGASSGYNSGDHIPISLNGGAYPGFSGDVQVLHNIGVGAEIFWKGSQVSNSLVGVNYRPLFFNFNVVYSPRLSKYATAELVGGIGTFDTRYYTASYVCVEYCSNYTSTNRFDGDFGGGIKFYPKGGWFIRPEARFYLINNNAYFSSNFATRYGVSVGYTFGRH